MPAGSRLWSSLRSSSSASSMSSWCGLARELRLEVADRALDVARVELELRAVASGPPIAGSARKSNSPSSSLPTFARRSPSALRRVASACSLPMRSASAFMSRVDGFVAARPTSARCASSSAARAVSSSRASDGPMYLGTHDGAAAAPPARTAADDCRRTGAVERQSAEPQHFRRRERFRDDDNVHCSCARLVSAHAPSARQPRRSHLRRPDAALAAPGTRRSGRRARSNSTRSTGRCAMPCPRRSPTVAGSPTPTARASSSWRIRRPSRPACDCCSPNCSARQPHHRPALRQTHRESGTGARRSPGSRRKSLFLPPPRHTSRERPASLPIPNSGTCSCAWPPWPDRSSRVRHGEARR